VYESDESTIVAEGLNAEGARRSAGGTVISPYSRAEDPSLNFKVTETVTEIVVC